MATREEIVFQKTLLQEVFDILNTHSDFMGGKFEYTKGWPIALRIYQQDLGGPIWAKIAEIRINVTNTRTWWIITEIIVTKDCDPRYTEAIGKKLPFILFKHEIDTNIKDLTVELAQKTAKEKATEIATNLIEFMNKNNFQSKEEISRN
jgi:hypothetical protein